MDYQLGPFSPKDKDSIEAIFKQKNVRFEIIIDEQHIQEAKNHKVGNINQYYGFHYDPRFIYFLVDERDINDFEKLGDVKDKLARYGINVGTFNDDHPTGEISHHGMDYERLKPERDNPWLPFIILLVIFCLVIIYWNIK